jgi:DNA-binding GntR family transcriptional regulator
MATASDLQERAYLWTRQKLLTGRVRSPRDLSRRRLAKELGVSPGSVDYALSRLEGEGLLVSRPQSGTFIRQLSDDEFRHLFEVRAWIETNAAALAARRVSPGQMIQLEEACREMAELLTELEQATPSAWPKDHAARVVRVEHLFHGTIVEACGNPMAVALVDNLCILAHMATQAPRWPRPAYIADCQRTLADHRGILEALRNRNAALARRRMRQHLLLASDRMPPRGV